ncbi:MAG: NgoPII family restriction endonuclease, partial [Cyanobacteria bacterium J149]
NNPPDMILKQGDAIEVKKIQSLSSAIALNSSYPKSKLYYDDPSITASCRNCENWSEKDILYTIGVTSDRSLRHLWLVYGDCYAANKEVYTRIKTTISQGVNSIKGVEFAETKELGRVNKVDPLGITNLRIRGMWHIDNPLKVFDYLYQIDEQKAFSMACLMRKSKFDSFPFKDRNSLQTKPVQVRAVKIKNPNNPAKLIDAVLMSFYVEK